MQGRFLLNVVVAQRAAILELLSGENQALLIRRDALLVLNLGLDIVNRVAGLNVESNGLPGKSFDENLKSIINRRKSLVVIGVVPATQRIRGYTSLEPEARIGVVSKQAG